MTSQTHDEEIVPGSFYFLLEFDGVEIPFKEVTGLESEIEPVEFRSENNNILKNIKLPSTRNHTVTFKNGITTQGESLSNWLSSDGIAIFKFANVKLYDSSGNVTMSWKLYHAFPLRLSMSELKSDSNEFVVELFELAHDGLNNVRR